MGSRKRITLALVALVALVVIGWLVKACARDSGGPGATSGMPVKALSALPSQAGDTWQLIVRGGPIRHPQDGEVFQNREGLLPREPAGYYHEYTVDTPGSADRGARRLIHGSGAQLYYTADHYQSFVVVDPEH